MPSSRCATKKKSESYTWKNYYGVRTVVAMAVAVVVVVAVAVAVAATGGRKCGQ